MSELFVGFFWTQSVEPFTLSTKELRWRWQCFILKSSLMCEWDTFVLRTHNPDHALMNFNNLKFIVKPLIGYLQFKELRPCSYFVTHNCIITFVWIGCTSIFLGSWLKNPRPILTHMRLLVQFIVKIPTYQWKFNDKFNWSKYHKVKRVTDSLPIKSRFQ